MWHEIFVDSGANCRNRWGIDAVALDAQDPDKVYAAIGMYTNDW